MKLERIEICLKQHNDLSGKSNGIYRKITRINVILENFCDIKSTDKNHFLLTASNRQKLKLKNYPILNIQIFNN